MKKRESVFLRVSPRIQRFNTISLAGTYLNVSMEEEEQEEEERLCFFPLFMNEECIGLLLSSSIFSQRDSLRIQRSNTILLTETYLNVPMEEEGICFCFLFMKEK